MCEEEKTRLCQWLFIKDWKEKKKNKKIIFKFSDSSLNMCEGQLIIKMPNEKCKTIIMSKKKQNEDHKFA